MDTSGAAMGLVAAAAVVFLLQREVVNLQIDTYRWLIILGIIPAFMALFFFVFIREPPGQQACQAAPSCKAGENPTPAVSAPALSNKFKIFLCIVFLFTLGNSSDAFLILRAQNLGNNVFYIILMMVLFNAVYAIFSVPAGMLSDKIGRRKVILLGWGVYALVYLGFAVLDQAWTVWLLWGLYGLYYGLAEGVARALVCDLVPEDKRGTAFGMYHGVVGITLLPASLIAGWLWQSVNPAAPFYFGAVMAGLAVIGMLLFIRD
jgi:sugar phosphate permease